MADISKEINDFRVAVYGRDVRESMISLAEKVNEEVETNTTHVDEAVTTANGASQKATKASEEVQKAITEANTTLQEANAAKVSAQASATASAGSASAAAGSASAASGSAADAAASAKAAEDIAAGMGGFDGTATSVKATDTQGIVVAAGADSNAQALLDALARKVALELVSNTALTTKLADYLKKTDIVQTESTATNKVPSSAYLKQVKDSIDSNLAYITGVMPSSTENRKKVADYPDGWNINSVKGMVPIVYRMDNITAWVTIGSNATFYLMADGIYAYTNDSNFSQKQFKLLLRK